MPRHALASAVSPCQDNRSRRDIQKASRAHVRTERGTVPKQIRFWDRPDQRWYAPVGLGVTRLRLAVRHVKWTERT
jgi:hypothetical protein